MDRWGDEEHPADQRKLLGMMDGPFAHIIGILGAALVTVIFALIIWGRGSRDDLP